MNWLRDTFQAFEVADFRRLWSGSLFATTAFMMSFMLVPSVAFEITGSNAAAGFAQMGSGVSMFVIAPIGGVIADRVRKKPIVLAGQMVPALAILGTGILIVTDQITIPLLTLGTLIMGFGFAFMGPARQAWTGELVPRRLLPNAVALQQIAMSVSQVAGPLLIAILVGTWVGIGGTYLFMACLFLIVLPLTLSLPNTKPAVPPDQRRSIRIELVAGVRYVTGNPHLRVLWLSFIGIIVCGFAFQTLLPGLLSSELDRSPTDVGLIFLAFAVGGLIVNIPLANVVRTRLAWPMLLGMGLIMAVGFWLISAAPTYQLVVLAGIPLGIGRSGFMLLNNSLLMANANPAFYGRVMSLSMMGFGLQALLAPVWGTIADSVGVRETMFVVGIVAAIVTVLATLAWLRIRGIAPSADSALATAAVGPRAAEVRGGPAAPTAGPAAGPPPIAARIPRPPRAEPTRAAPAATPVPAAALRPGVVASVALGASIALAAVIRRNGNGNGHAANGRPPHGLSGRRRSRGPAPLNERVWALRYRVADWLDPPRERTGRR